MDPEFWHQRWRNGEIGFHQDTPHLFLAAHWPGLGVAPGGRVLVPLCGKSRDMHWLANAGHRVIGIELSALAVEAFFADARLDPAIASSGAHHVYSAGAYEIWCGDIFDVQSEPLSGVAAVYDRASLVALPRALRVRYAQWLSRVIAPATPMLLVSLSYEQSEMSGPPFAVTDGEVANLFVDEFSIERLSARQAMDDNPGLRKRGLTSLIETAFLLRRKP
ncbi:MAG: thiopurine S-methyltransferase [Hyphomicrobiaceae bacterium]|nr:thiopurine S-methyltransferase [Hyphomicrobiaceae bacterium]